MFNKFDFKYIIKRVIIALAIAFILFNVNKCNAHALVYKNSEWYGLDSSIKSGSLSGTSNGVNITISLNHSLENFDYIAYPLSRYNFTTNPVLIDTDYVEYCTNWDVSQYTYTCHTTSSSNLQNYSYTPVDYTISYVITTTNGSGSSCFLSADYQGYVICPTNRLNGYAKQLEINISYNGSSSNSILYYYLSLGGTVNYLNNDSTEIVNGLGGIQQEQQNTNDIITDSSTSQSTTSGQNFMTNGQSAISNKFEQATSYNQFTGILNNFLTQMSNSTCQPINLPIPYTEETLVLPCLGNEFSQRIPALWTLYKLIITGALGIVLWKYFIGFIKAIMDPYNIGATNLPIGGGK